MTTLQAACRGCLLPRADSKGAHAAAPFLTPALPPRRRRGRSLAVLAISQEQEQRGSGGGPPPLPGSGGGGGGPARLANLSEVIRLTIEEYDDTIQKSVTEVEEARRNVRDIETQIQQQRQEADMPEWGYGLLSWSRTQAQRFAEEGDRRRSLLESRRGAFVAGLRQLEAEIRANPPTTDPDENTAAVLAAAGYQWAQAQGEKGSPEQLMVQLRKGVEQTAGPISTMWASAATSLISAYGVAWVGSWFGTDAYRLLHDTPNWVAVAPTWLAWTVPYVAGTLAAYALNPLSVTKVAIRLIANEQMQLYRDVPLASCVSVAAIVAFCQCLTWQGLWQDAFTGYLGGSRDPFLLTDPGAVADGVRASMGTLVGAPLLPAFLVTPGAAVLTGALEAGFYYTCLTLQNVPSFTFLGQTIQRDEWMGGPDRVSLPSNSVTATELPVVAARVAAAGTYLALEASLTGSLWLAVGTSAAGIITGILLNRRSSV